MARTRRWPRWPRKSTAGGPWACTAPALPTWLALAAAVLLLCVHGQPGAAGAHQALFGPVYTLLDNKYYMDWINENIFAGGLRCWVPACGGWDVSLIDGAVVNGSWRWWAGSPVPCAGCSRATSITTRWHDPGHLRAHDVLRLAQQVSKKG
jgi:NADH:ubiquinone oxidoreductase subunit 5 (subunit L)/multisubunit Na+/H+ antiporter MnhA subunit